MTRVHARQDTRPQAAPIHLKSKRNYATYSSNNQFDQQDTVKFIVPLTVTYPLDNSPQLGYIPQISLTKGRLPEVCLETERERCPRAELRPLPGSFGYQARRHYGRRVRCITGLGQTGVGNAHLANAS
jgi:hypothetical protein